MTHSPEDDADELDRIGRIMTLSSSGEVPALSEDEESEHLDRLNELLLRCTSATIGCITAQTREFLEGYTEGAPEYDRVRVLLGYYES